MKDYNEKFIKLLDNIEDYENVGLGNPNSNILFVGKEPAIDIEINEDFQQIKEKLRNLPGSKLNWKSNEFDYSHNPDQLKDLSDTWKNYQQLYNSIFIKRQQNNFATFLKEVFTTEMSNLPSKKTDKARRNPFFTSELQRRKENFFKTDFIQSFPVVVLACSDYIVNNDKNREIDKIFGVQFNGEFKEYSKGNWFFNHYNEDKTKIVIHTRQLSSNINNELLFDIGKNIKEHLIKLNLYYCSVDN
jgi:hypothetical protein